MGYLLYDIILSQVNIILIYESHAILHIFIINFVNVNLSVNRQAMCYLYLGGFFLSLLFSDFLALLMLCFTFLRINLCALYTNILKKS